MRWPFLSRRSEPGPIQVDLPADITPGFAVFFRPSGGGPPENDELLLKVKRWLGRYATDPLRGLLVDWIDHGMLIVRVVPTSQTPPLDLDALHASGMSPGQERTLGDSSHAAVVMGKDLGLPPHPGLWSAVAGARALVGDLGGVAFDMTTRRLLPPGDEHRGLPDMGAMVIPDHLAIEREDEEGPSASLATLGMAKFGLPDLIIRGVPGESRREASMVLGGLAALIAGWAMPYRERAEGHSVRARLEPFWHLDMTEVLAAHAIDPADPFVEPAGETTVQLSTDPATRRSRLPRLEVKPATGAPAGSGSGVRGLIGQLFGAAGNYFEFPADLPGLGESLARIAADLPAIKGRFLGGLPPGAQLSVKRGFPVEEGRSEYLWVGVGSWSGDRIRGRIENDPVRCAGFDRGQVVEFGESEVFDWLITHPDGTREGARMNDFLARAGGVQVPPSP